MVAFIPPLVWGIAGVIASFGGAAIFARKADCTCHEGYIKVTDDPCKCKMGPAMVQAVEASIGPSDTTSAEVPGKPAEFLGAPLWVWGATLALGGAGLLIASAGRARA